MSFLRNCWYIAGWADEFKECSLTPRTFLNEQVVMFRDSKGVLQALQDRCPHRFVPLHLGRLKDDRVQCAYHGLSFDCTGACVHNPHGNGVIPRAARVRKYPMEERHGFAWIWMGEAERADPSLICDFSPLDPKDFYVGKSYLHVKANYMLETDNILDLSHIEFLHASSLGSNGVAQGTTEVVQEGETVYSKRSTSGERLTHDLERLRGVPAGQLVDRWLDVRWNAPAVMLLETGLTPAGQPRESGRSVHVAHVFSPETESTSHYWFGIAFPRALGGEGERLARENIDWLSHPFTKEDMPMLEAQQRTIGDQDFWSLKPVLLASDAAAVRVRRTLDDMIKQEQSKGVGQGQ
ncbi:vanillate monooxygenase [Burkholderia diffusa]|uniref:Vanillate monooxygenase n=1 Tax=Burkholderia diffusa TaxID=488732 RepID=A0AAW3P9U9_9BURK|nr:aromatic ring-hydroxylating dioxygenase subunit alpha [Burkholderia diffusa]KWF32784.1 vanillate monooxygenase [Burkholderia diffusa]KWF38707.1 vanillate monooxygenase [Burkholderia diffusa]KWF46752.1 vanillate monooxygenase [Burkholderia diffusa]KWF50678.1 vanillate monooxygenase [Burkholderia diffusa]